MPKYVLTYHGEAGPMPDDPEIMGQVMAAWGAWYESMGSALVDGGAPFGASTSVGPDGSATANPATMSGYTIVEASDMGAASDIARGCPVLENGHTVQISESIDLGQ